MLIWWPIQINFSRNKYVCGVKWYSNVTVLASPHHTNQNKMNEWTKTQNTATISDRVTDFFSLLYSFLLLLSSLFTSLSCRIVNQWTVCIKVASSAHAHLQYMFVFLRVESPQESRMKRSKNEALREKETKKRW